MLMSGDQGVGVPLPSTRVFIGAQSPEFKLSRAFLLRDSYEPS